MLNTSSIGVLQPCCEDPKAGRIICAYNCSRQGCAAASHGRKDHPSPSPLEGKNRSNSSHVFLFSLLIINSILQERLPPRAQPEMLNGSSYSTQAWQGRD